MTTATSSATEETTTGRVCVLGSFMMDLTVHAERRPDRGETLIGERFVQRLGGKGFNQAVAAARAGAAVSMLGCVGDDDYGLAFLSALDVEGIARSGVRRVEGIGTGVGLPLVERDGANSIVVVAQANGCLLPSDVEDHRTQIEEADVLCLQLELPHETALIAAKIAVAAGRQVLVNPAPARPGCGEVLDMATILVPNHLEAAMLAGLAVSEAVADAATALAERFSSAAVVVTNGSGGAVVGGPTSRLFPAPPVTAVDTIGAGDVFCGFLAARVAGGHALDVAVAEAVGAASLSVTRGGGVDSTPTAAEVARLNTP